MPTKRESIADAIPHNPAPAAPRRYPCFADGCPMPGTMFTGASDGPGTCPFHFNAAPLDVPRITRTLNDWRGVARAMNTARRLAIGPLATSPTAQLEAMADAWIELRAEVDEVWHAELKPGNVRVRDHSSDPPGWRELPVPEGPGDWARRLERFLGARVVECLGMNRSRNRAERAPC